MIPYLEVVGSIASNNPRYSPSCLILSSLHAISKVLHSKLITSFQQTFNLFVILVKPVLNHFFLISKYFSVKDSQASSTVQGAESTTCGISGCDSVTLVLRVFLTPGNSTVIWSLGPDVCDVA